MSHDWYRNFARYYQDALRAHAQSSSRSLVNLGALLRKQLACDVGAFGVAFEEMIGKEKIILDLAPSISDEETVESDDIYELDDEDELGHAEPPAVGQPGSTEREIAGRAARKIHRTQVRDPYNRETSLGGPLFQGWKGNRRISGPLFYWEVDSTYDPRNRRLTLVKRSSVPEFNTMLIDPFLDEDQGIGEIVEPIRARMTEGDFDLECLSDLIISLGGLVDRLGSLSLKGAADEPLGAWLRAPSDDCALNLRGALINSTRSNAALLEDLRTIERLSEIPRGGPLDILTNPDDPTRDPSPQDYPFSFSDTADGGDPLWFPFSSNLAQRRVARMAARARILTVQGPPGTGKSHTIANLVCHLAASGKSVLVTSHQGKAVEVVTNLLKTFPRLALSLADGDRRSSQQLRLRIREFLEDHTLDLESTRREVAVGSDAIAKLDREMRILAGRFQELSRREHESWSGFRSYAELREFDFIHEDDVPHPEESDRIARALPEWCKLRLEIGDSLPDLLSFASPDGPETTGAFEDLVFEGITELSTLSRAVLNAPTSPVAKDVRSVLAEYGRREGGAEVLGTDMRAWIRTTGWEIVRASERGSVVVGGSTSLTALARHASLTTRDGLEGMESRLRGLEQSLLSVDDWESLVELPEGVEELQAVREALDLLRSGTESLLRWHLSPSVRQARRVLERIIGRTISRGTASRAAARLGASLSIDSTKGAVAECIAELNKLLPEEFALSHPPRRSTERVEWLACVRRGEELARLLKHCFDAPVGLWLQLSKRVPGAVADAVDRPTLEAVDAAIEAALADLQRERFLQRLEERLPVTVEWRDRLGPLIEELREGRIGTKGLEVLEVVDRIATYQYEFRRLRNLERRDLTSLPGTRQELGEEILKTREVPVWVSDRVLEALRARQLASLITGSLRADPDSIRSVATQLRRGEDKRQALLHEMVERRVRMHQAEATHGQNLHAELQRVQRLLNMGTRVQKSLISLRSSIDYASVLKVFPVWLARIDDACRLFPATPGLFDYIIVDEASQCAQPALLPLALRCKHLIVVGDEKQLRPTFARFISRSELEALQAKHKLAAHRSGLFAEGGDSLLDFASFRANQNGFLDEHFRCDPAIIAWSNEHYYRNRLKILTHRRTHRFRPALRVVELQGADDDPDRKVNIEEAKAVVREVRRLVEDPTNRELTVGVLSPFRQQSDVIQSLLEREFSKESDVMERHRILSSTADGFQGDERDIILYSFRMGPSSHPNSLGALERAPERFNVAFSRARRLGISFLSCDVGRLPSGGIVRSWIQHCRSVQSGEAFAEGVGRPDHFDSEFERSVCMRLRDRGLTVVTQEPCGPFRIDLVVQDSEGRMLAVECDGEWKHDSFGHLRPEDYQRQDLIERAGWTVHRISGRSYLLDPTQEIDVVLSQLARQPNEQARAVLAGDAFGLPGVFGGAGHRDFGDGDSDPDDHDPDPNEGQDEEDDGDDGDSAAMPGSRPDPGPVPPQVVFGRPLLEVKRLLHQLVRWSLRSSQGVMADRLFAIDESLKNGAPLTSEQIAVLEFIKELADQQGFDPEEVIRLA